MKTSLPLALVLLAGVAQAQNEPWRVTVTPYLWATDVGIDIDLDGRSVVSETIPVDDLIDDIDLTFQGHLEAVRGAHGVAFDLFYVSMSDSTGNFPLPESAGDGSLDWQMDMTLADLAGVYDPGGDGRGVSFLYGLRLIDQRADADATFQTSSGTQHESYGGSDTWVDALLGVRYRAQLTQNLGLMAQLDASTGGTESTWSASPSLTYSLGSSFALVAGYRHMEVDFGEQDGLDSRMTLSGPVLGLRASL